VAAVGEQEVELAFAPQLGAEGGDLVPELADLPVLPSGASCLSLRRLILGSVPLCANTQCRPQSARLNGCVFSSDARPRVFFRTWAIDSSVLMGLRRMKSAIALVQAGVGSRKFRANFPS
jgi:hypothetical protein